MKVLNIMMIFKYNTLKIGAVQDDSAKTQVYTLHDTVIVTA